MYITYIYYIACYIIYIYILYYITCYILYQLYSVMYYIFHNKYHILCILHMCAYTMYIYDIYSVFK